jgi:hypothetical protein
MATKAAVPTTAAVLNETADAADAGMPKAHRPKHTHEQGREEQRNRAHKTQAHHSTGTAQAQHEHTASARPARAHDGKRCAQAQAHEEHSTSTRTDGQTDE